jgi:hypothetical protein
VFLVNLYSSHRNENCHYIFGSLTTALEACKRASRGREPAKEEVSEHQRTISFRLLSFLCGCWRRHVFGTSNKIQALSPVIAQFLQCKQENTHMGGIEGYQFVASDDEFHCGFHT